MKKIVVFGSREGISPVFIRNQLAKFADLFGELVEGGCRGVDTEAREWARYMGIRVKEFPADWAHHGREVGPIRNREMAQYAEMGIAFCRAGSRGTLGMVAEMRMLGKPVIVYHI